MSSAVYSDRELFHTAKIEGFRKTIEVSLFGAYYGLRAAATQMIKQGRGGAAVIISSPHAKIAFPSAMAYNIAKAGVDPGTRLVELRLDDVDGFRVGQEITADVMAKGERVDVTAVSRGKGWAGACRVFEDGPARCSRN